MRIALILALALLGVASADFARASVLSLNDLAKGQFLPSESPTLLGPIDAVGRTGWQCAPERAATTQHAATAELPQPHDP
jgi:hypothetical protein